MTNDVAVSKFDTESKLGESEKYSLFILAKSFSSEWTFLDVYLPYLKTHIEDGK